jgi:mono/diheme cytochrome c family protein
MKKLIIILIVGAVVIACGNAGNSADAGGAARTAAVDNPDGAKLYKQYCVTCHGLYGDMGVTGAYNLQESKLSLEERVAVITNGRNTMTGFKTLLSEDKIKAIAEYTFKLKS